MINKSFLSFEIELFKVSYDKGPLISPYSIGVCLTKIFNLINSDEDKLLLLKVLKCNTNDFSNYSNKMTKIVKDIEQNLSIKTANLLFKETEFEPNKCEQYNNQNFPEIIQLNSLINSTPSSINKIVKSKTNGRIKELMNPMMRMNDNHVAMSSVTTFECRFKNPFTNHSKHRFHGFHESKATFMMVKKRENIIYSRRKGMTMVQLPFEDDKTSLCLIMPNKKGEKYFHRMIEKMNLKTFQSLFSHRITKKLDLMIPELDIETDSFNCFDHLAKLGIESESFHLENEDKLIHFRQKCSFSLNKKGTVPKDNNFVPEEKKNIHYPKVAFNRPFLYFVMNHRPEVVLLCGSILMC
ncbi:hypothetical protein TRFO_11801 [Tritrichomonas foetus]|uniref:Serpin domain-containing protein n=1 Tax=Tritrichomonas foetus TaxID=1144522 RepID=A0A1J4J837_9EUKA|nr:hypothetical protein TRFO_11801 [Tritrichomonas foetus]|eukprot:OHS93396.1 hypothetical protein TRFO_11801 [Tritrichomonas foetus]